MRWGSEGMRRLAIVLGVSAALAWVTWAGRNFPNEPSLLTWVVFAIGALLSFGAAYVVVRATDWVISGFRKGDKS